MNKENIPQTILDEYENSSLVIDEQTLKEGVKSIASKIKKAIGKDDITVSIVAILTGGLPFAKDLTKELTNLGFKCDLHYVRVNRYKDNKRFANNDENERVVWITNILDIFKSSRAIVIADDIWDTGITMLSVKKEIENKMQELNVTLPIYTATVIYVDNNEFSKGAPDFWIYTGKVEDWYFGYGMDLRDEYFRNINEIRKVNRA